ncbi:MAG: NAD-dependent deacylase [Spirochaetales bacterium]|nr:NAD-dependent deacylase [Leptospiraceae bacterium]MCP5480137.1 NAD-dependent deacylase [Spirochaetales bacterium]MCP5485523.1 NAD-dependent deacylase [Spirochaetales bacterium]
MDVELTRRLREARRLAFITGAGVSAESGIPTFRGAQGLWRNFRPEDLATPTAFARDPLLVWQWYEWRRALCSGAEPNAAHKTIAAIEADFSERFLLITQNVDGLHFRAGSRRMIEVHGSLFRVRCVSCQHRAEHPYRTESRLPPRCPLCDNLLRPDVVWFGETYDQIDIRRALDFLSDVSLVCVLGTSGMVPMPVHLAEHARQYGAYIVDINTAESALTPMADRSLRGAAAEILPALWSEQL